MIGITSRGGQVIVPIGDTELKDGDHLIVFTTPALVGRVEKIFANR